MSTPSKMIDDLYREYNNFRDAETFRGLLDQFEHALINVCDLYYRKTVLQTDYLPEFLALELGAPNILELEKVEDLLVKWTIIRIRLKRKIEWLCPTLVINFCVLYLNYCPSLKKLLF